MDNTSKVVLVTGASSGFGCAISTALAAKSYRVFGTARAPRAGPSEGFTTLTLDVTQDESVTACIADVIRAAGRAVAESLIRDAYGLK